MLRIKKPEVLLTIVFALLPAVIWLAFSLDRSSPLIKLTGLSGLGLLSWNIILSGRLPFLDRLFLGLDRVYRLHRLTGGLSVILLTIHATLVFMRHASFSYVSAYEYMLPSANMPLNAGKLGLLILITFSVVIFYLKVRYQWFVISMRILGAVIFIGGYHAFFAHTGDVPHNLPLAICMGITGGTAAGVYIYRSLFRRPLNKIHRYRVSTIDVSGGITEVWLHPIEHPLPFYAGQFVFVRFMAASLKSEEHPFTISNGSGSKWIRLCMKDLGDYTKKVQELNVGTEVRIEGPFGSFSFSKLQSHNQVWVAGGIGITPFLSMAHSLPTHGYQVDLYYSVKTEDEARFLPELQKLSAKINGLRIIPVIAERDGLLTADIIKKMSPQAQDYLLCGPPVMRQALIAQLKKLGVQSANIHYEEFNLS